MIQTIEKKYSESNKIVGIDIDSQHQAKLYEMCNNIIENNNPNATIYVVSSTIKIPKQGKKDFGYNEMHWFELCTTHLAFHIMSEPMEYLKYTLDYSMNKYESTNPLTLKKHPIDYLYAEYDSIRELFKNEFNYKGSRSNKQHFHNY
jgi:hypothetical protein